MGHPAIVVHRLWYQVAADECLGLKAHLAFSGLQSAHSFPAIVRGGKNRTATRSVRK